MQDEKAHIIFLNSLPHAERDMAAAVIRDICESYRSLVEIRDTLIDGYGEMEPNDPCPQNLADAYELALAHRDGRKANDPDDPERNGKIAEREGWCLVENDGRYDIERDDSADKFEHDADALIHVATRAKEGSAYHRAALELIGREPSV